MKERDKMAQPISPQIWNKAAITDNRLLPGRYSVGIFTGKGVNIANNQEAYAYDDILVSDRIFDYDDRRLNGLGHDQAVSAGNLVNDGWGASAYGPFQTVRFTRRVFTSGQHKSIAWRVFDEKQYGGSGYGAADSGFGDAATSLAITGGEAYLSTAETINKAKKIWDAEILGPHIDKYNFFAIANGHISGRFVQTDASHGAIFEGRADKGTWIASPGPYEGLSYPPEFAPIKAIEWDSLNVRPMLNAIDVAWTNLFIPEDNRVILLDKSYKDDLLSNLIGVPGSIPASDKAYDALTTGKFERLMGWDFDFSIPSQYFPYVYVDSNNNVVHTSDGAAAYDAVINSIDAGDGRMWLTTELAESQRMRATNYIGRYFDSDAHAWVTVVSNYPGNGNPSNVGAAWDTQGAHTDTSASFSVGAVATTHLSTFPFVGYPGQGLDAASGHVDPITLKRVIGMAVYRPAAQLGQEYGAMETDRGKTRGKFTELVFDVKHDAWVIPQFSHGILLIVDSTANTGTPSLKVEIVQPAVLALNYTSTAPVAADMDASNEDDFQLTWDMDGVGNYDNRVTFATDNAGIATVSAAGLVHAVGIGTAGITITSVANPDCHDFINIPVQA
jgi:hypothetical protein